MDKQLFGLEMAKTAAVTRSELDPLTIQAYWEEFELWTDSVFQNAMKQCRQELASFPKASQIRGYRFNLSAPRTYSTPDTFKCISCLDTGALEIYHPKAYRPIKDGTFEAGRDMNTVMVACSCPERIRHQAAIQPGEKGRCRPLIDFDSNVMKVVTNRMPDEEELIDFVMNHWKPRTRDEEYAWQP